MANTSNVPIAVLKAQFTDYSVEVFVKATSPEVWVWKKAGQRIDRDSVPFFVQRLLSSKARP